jgi:hypothetical protein
MQCDPGRTRGHQTASICRTLEILRLDAGRSTIVSIFTERDTLRAEPFDAIELDLSLVFNEPRSEPQP